MDIITHNQLTFHISEDRDPDFGENGVINLFKLDHELDLDRHVKGIKVLADDKILVGAWLARDLMGIYGLARFNPDGRLDTSFADRGLAQGNFAEGYDCTGGRLAIQADGCIVMLGWSRELDVDSPKRLVISRFDQNGAIDHNFGQRGCVVIDNTDLGELESDSSAVQILTDGKLLVSATYMMPSSSIGVVLRINARGELDKSFNKTGQLEIKNPAFTGTSASALLVQPDHSVLVAGGAQYTSSETQGYIARYAHTGELDASYGDSATPGFSILKIADGTVIFHELIDAGEEKIIGVGQASLGQRNWGMLVGLDANGHPHQAFNGGRPVLTSFNAEHGNEWVCAHRQTDGKIIAAGGVNRLYTARYLANGSIDRGFGQSGSVQEDTPLMTQPAVLQTQANGRILLAANTLGIGGALGHIYGYRS